MNGAGSATFGMYILGVNESHNASSVLIKDGVVVAAAQEERFTRVKGQGGIPIHSISYCLSRESIHITDIDRIVFGFRDPLVAAWYGGQDSGRWYFIAKAWIESFIGAVSVWIPRLAWVYAGSTAFLYRIALPLLQRAHRRVVCRRLGIEEKRCEFVDHHTAHVWAAYGCMDRKVRENVLVITNDGMGDERCGLVAHVRRGKLRELASTPNAHSLGMLYAAVTELLGFRPNEDEHKVMGLSAYVPEARSLDAAALFSGIIRQTKLTMRAAVPPFVYRFVLPRLLSGKRFDDIAAGLQRKTEEILTRLVTNAVRTIHVRNVALSGGLALNIKANKAMSEIAGVRSLWVCPSGGDESTAMGAAVWATAPATRSAMQVRSLYLGPQYSENEIEEALRAYRILHNPRYDVQHFTGPRLSRHIARLLATGHVVARFAGRMEFGARALGNRSILADPRYPEVVHNINRQIKGRDFWMPFAPTILAEREKEYIHNPKHMMSPFMTMAFDTTQVGRRVLAAAIHPADGTTRPQILRKEDNREYYELLQAFEQETGVGALLNTSLNLHGEPIVCSPEDALFTFQRSGLEFLVMGSFLVRKVSGFS